MEKSQSDADKSDVHGLSPSIAHTWTRLSDFINGDRVLSVSEEGCFFAFFLFLFCFVLPEVNNLESFVESKLRAGWINFVGPLNWITAVYHTELSRHVFILISKVKFTIKKSKATNAGLFVS